MKLAIVEGTFAVCRLSVETPPPPWVFSRSSTTDFFSITKTAEELSIVCRQDIIPAETATLSSIEKEWSCIKVQGPLDFGLTGILSSLASPLAAAGVSIFAISTYDTDYLLVKSKTLEKAINVLREEGHVIVDEGTGGNKIGGPRDGPALSFEPDPLVATLVEEEKKIHPDPFFSLVVVAGWPPDRHQLEIPYQGFRRAVEQCWDECDRMGISVSSAPLYFYPFERLHVTAAMPFRHQDESISIDDDNEKTQSKIIETWKKVIQRATQLPQWPSKPLELEIDSAQIGKRAGILLWRDSTGGMEAIRHCIQAACHEEQETFRQANLSPDSLDVPQIIHSTFLRYYSEPNTTGLAVQQRFREHVLPKLSEFFPQSIRVPAVKLVCERTPYMHIPHDSNCVVATSFLAPIANSPDRFIVDCQVAEERLEEFQSNARLSKEN